ncbi:MAG: peptidase [bacterium]
MIKQKASKKYVNTQLNKLATVTIAPDLSYLPANERHVIKLLVKASKHIDSIFLEQVYEKNPQILNALKEYPESNQPYIDLFTIMFGPWNRLENNKPFINNIEKPRGANYYPLHMTKEMFNNWLKDHPDDREIFESHYTVIRKKNDKLIAVPYAEEYFEELKSAVRLLKQAAQETRDQTLSVFLNKRAESFLTNEYYESNMAWMDLDGDIEVVIGPYEVYEDRLFGYKAAFESFVCVVDHEESKNLTTIGNYLDKMEDNLPIPDRHKNFNRGSSSPIKVVNEIFTAGDTKAGVQTLAFNLPNDERVREAKGSKKVLLKNVMKAKFDKILRPIAAEVLTADELEKISFDAYFKHILMHEVSHGLGPGTITLNGKETSVSRELKNYYSVIEECKADVLGVYNILYLMEEDVLDEKLHTSLFSTNLAGMFRSIRFGIEEAHGGANAIQLNYYLEKGAVSIDDDGLFSVNNRKYREAVQSLAEETLMIEAQGDTTRAKKLIEGYSLIKPEVETALSKLTEIPVDIKPVYSIENEL